MSSDARRMRVTVVVLGDLGRSPRMLYHARALGDTVAEVDLLGYVEHPLPAAVASHPHVRVHRLRAPASCAAARLPRLAFLVYGLWRSARQAVALFWTLVAGVARPDVVLVQNPPSVPTLAIALAAARLRGARLVVDWHNLGAAMLALALGARHPVVRAAAWYERVLGRRADAHLAVSGALAEFLRARWGIAGAVVLYDRPGDAFAPTPLAERHALFARLAPLSDPGEPGGARDDTLVTYRRADGTLALRPDRPALVVSPTSWTADEDFGLLFDALGILDARWRREGDARGTRALVLLTGDGPLRARSEERIAALGLATVAVRTLWLDPSDYSGLLGAADLGLSLHRSASGLDLPMKIADLFGAGVPVCALDYGPVLAEQVRDGETGLLFRDAAALSDRLHALLGGFPADTAVLDGLRANVAAHARVRWTEEWLAVARPVFERCRRP